MLFQIALSPALRGFAWTSSTSVALLVIWSFVTLRILANIIVLPRLKPKRVEIRSEPFVSIIVPARNEARDVEETILALLSQRYESFEVIVVNDCSTDGTPDIARSIRNSRLHVVDGREPPAGWLGKPWALDQASRVARGELLLFVDADILYHPDAVSAAVSYFMLTPGLAMLALLPRFVMRGFWENVAMPGMMFLGFSLLPAELSNGTRFAPLGVGIGTGNLVRRDVYDRVGGHGPLKNAIVDDVALARLFRKHGEQTRVVRADDFVSVRMYHGGAEVLSGFTKNAFAFLNRNYLLGGVFLLLILASSIFPYGAAVMGDRIAAATVLLLTAGRVILFARLGYPRANAVFAHPLMAAFWVVIFLRSIWVTGIRRTLTWRDRTYDVRTLSCFGDS